MFVRCPFCHARVLRWLYPAHERRHVERLPDGQMRDHVTLAPNARFRGSLDNVPQAYRHPACGVVTAMPEDIIRSYLVNPLLYSDGSFCGGCGDYIDSAELFWVETDESVLAYLARLRIAYLARHYGIVAPDDRVPILVTPLAVAAIRRIMRDQRVKPPMYLCVARDGTNHTADLTTEYDPRTEMLVGSEVGIPVLVQRKQFAQLRGTVVEYQPDQNGFGITRIIVPQ